MKINLPNVVHIGFLPPVQPDLKEFYAPKMEEGDLKRFMQEHPYIAFKTAKQRVQEKIDKLYNDAMKKADIKNQQIFGNE